MGAATIVYAASIIPKNVRPPSVSYTKSTWSKYFTSLSLDHQVQKEYGEAIESLKEEAKRMLMANNGNTKARKLVLIDTLERLGIAYHFEEEIEEQLGHIFKNHCEITTDHEDSDLFINSLQFRLLRQHRYHVPCSTVASLIHICQIVNLFLGVFDKFIGKDKKFKEHCIDDAKGLLSLYEAAHLRTHGEPILDEAVAFSVHHLKRMVQQLDSSSSTLLEDQVRRALEILPLHRSVPRIETRNYISLYEKDDTKDDLLLKLAKLDFNYLQNMYKKDLHELSRWFEELKLESDFPYARDRIVESYLWGASLRFEPQYSYVRMTVAKTFQMVTILDDMYDNYATVEEAGVFTEIMQRWNIDEIDQLPEYMKKIYRLVLSEYEDFEREAAEKGKLFALPYAKETVKEICKAYNKEKKWIMGREEMPCYQEYVENVVPINTFFLLSSRTILGLKSATKETIDWLQSEPKIVLASCIVGRYLDDVAGYQRESQGGQLLTGLDFFMKEHGVSVEEATSKFMELAEDGWKDLNAEWVAFRDPQVPKELVDQLLGYARISEVTYRRCQDGFADPRVVAPHIAALFVDPIQL